MEKIKKLELIKKIKIALFFIYLLFFLMFGGRPETVKYSEAILLVFLALEGARIIKTKKIKYCMPIIITFIFAFYCFLSNFWAINSELSIEKSKTLFILSSFLLITYNFFSDVQNAEEYILKIIMYAGIAFSIYVILYYGFGEYFNKLMNGERVGEEINNVNVIGKQISVPIILAIYYYIYTNKKFYLFSIIIPVIVSLGTGSRGVLISITIGILLVLFLKDKNNISINKIFKYLVFLIMIAIITIELFKMPIFSTIFKRFENMTNIVTKNGVIDNSTLERNEFIKVGFQQFLKNPIFGIGVANSGYITITVVPGFFTYLHNNFVELLACTGLIGFGLFYFSHIYIIFYCIKYWKKRNKYLNITLIIFLLNIVLDYGAISYYSKNTYVFFLLGLIAVKNERKKMNEKVDKSIKESKNNYLISNGKRII